MRALNKDIRERIAILKKGVKIDGLPVSVIGTDKALANLLGVSPRTVINWRQNDLIPFKMAGGIATYNVKKVIQALDEYSDRDFTYAEALAAVTKELDKVELYERIKALEARLDALTKDSKQQ